MNKKGFIFDLDGVIVDTAHFHFLAWKKTAAELGFELTEELNEKLKGVSRIDSLQKILDWANTSIDEERFDKLTSDKNEDYLTFVDQMTAKDILPGVEEFILLLKEKGYPIALGSASKNAPRILSKVGLLELFDTIVDGNSVSKAKPDPEVFLIAAKNLNVSPQECIVFEDSQAGIAAANIAGMTSVGLGEPAVLADAHEVFSSFTEIELDFIEKLITT
ncbi:beta-phosphoglucomutase [Ascidiimonas sp. W6]|uniref:beta-phosphoglucomutase n=1 Tax=Ascidiimonas meishanensis TaxID=3128903 RepID=UPI0030EDE635